MTWTLGYVAFLMAMFCFCSIGDVNAQPTTAAAKAASDKAQVEARGRELSAAGELLGQGKYVAAIAAYQKILTDSLDAETKMVAELGLARSLAGQDPAKGVERVQAFLERYDNAEPKIVVTARTALADAREGSCPFCAHERFTGF